MKNATKKQVIKWYEAGLTVDEFAPLIPQYCRQGIESVIKEYKEKKSWARIMNGSRS